MDDVIFDLEKYKNQKTPCVLCIVTEAEGSTPREAGAKMDVFSNFTSNRIQFMQSTGVIILAAGMSERMGSDKLCLKLPSGETFLSYLLSAYQRFGCTPCIVVVNQKTQPHALRIIKSASVPATVVVNPNPEAGRFLSLQMGLQAMKTT